MRKATLASILRKAPNTAPGSTADREFEDEKLCFGTPARWASKAWCRSRRRTFDLSLGRLRTQVRDEENPACEAVKQEAEED